MPIVYKRASAWQDLVDHYVYLAENASQDIADRFLINAEASFADLLQHPLIGAPMTFRRPELTGMRKWRVKEFDDTLIFYLPQHDGVSIVRVLHAAQDWWKLLSIKN